MAKTIQETLNQLTSRVSASLVKFNTFNNRADKFDAELRMLNRRCDKFEAKHKQLAIMLKALIDVKKKRRMGLKRDVLPPITVDDIIHWMELIVRNDLSELDNEKDGVDLLREISGGNEHE